MTLLLTERIGTCLVMTLNRPGRLNALNTALLDEIEAAFDRMETGQTQAVILTGAGRAFCTGSDMKEDHGNAGDMEAFANARIERMHRFLLRLMDLRTPTIAALNGPAYGGGLELALACTFRVAAPEARLCMPEICHNLIPSYGGTQLLPRLIGPGRALEMMLTGEAVPAEQALAIGLLNAIGDDAVATAISWAERLQGGAGLAQHLIRRSVTKGADLDLAAAFEIERRFAAQIAGSPQARQGLEHFRARRKIGEDYQKSAGTSERL